MRRLLNTLFVTTQGAYLRKEGETVVVMVEKKPRIRLPVLTLGGIVCFGRVSCSPALLGFCASRGVGISFLSERGRFLARVLGATTGNVRLRREQYRRSEDRLQAAGIARAFVLAKAANCRTSLMRALRDHPETQGGGEIRLAVSGIEARLAEIQREADLDSLRGIEGQTAHQYFAVAGHLILAQRDEFSFHGRNRRPPRDNFNALLSFIYTLMLHDIRSALEAVGLDPAVGFLHRDRPGRPSLALDLMEEFRPWLADRLALSLVNLRQVQGSGFQRSESGGVTMDDATRKTVVTTFQKRKQDEIFHPFLEEQMPIGMLFFAQALLLARFLRHDLDGYPPFFWK